MKILLHNARILKMNDEPIFISSLVVGNGKILYIGDDYSKYGPFDITRECNQNVIMPGFKNAHSHSAMSFLRSKGDGLTLHDWLFKAMFPREEKLTPERVYELSKVSYLEYLSSGITACFDQYFYPSSSAKSAEEIGMRIVLLGTYNKDRYSKEYVKENYLNYKSKSGLVSYELGIHAEYTATEEELAVMNELVHKLKAPFYLHICETEDEVKQCENNRGLGPIKFLAKNGFFDYGGGCYHCVHMDQEDIDIFKKYNLSVITCPGSNSKLGSGVAPIKKYLKEKLNIAIGTDGAASNNCLDMFKEMSLIYSLQNLNEKSANAISAYDILKMATVNGSKAMNLNDSDILEVGKNADIIEIDLSKPNMQPLNDIVSNIVYSGSKTNIKMTMINGNILYDDGKYSEHIDVDAIYENCQRITKEIDKEVELND